MNVRAFLLLAASVVLASCGGGGGGSEDPVDPPSACGVPVSLELGATVSASAQPGCDAVFRVSVPQGKGQLAVSALNGTGTSTLYVRQGQVPTDSEWLCRHDDGNADICEIGDAHTPNTFPQAGTWYVRVAGNVSNAQLTARVYDPLETTTITALSSGVTRSNVSVADEQSAYFSISVPVGSTKLTVRTSGGTGDADLYVGRGITPQTMHVECTSDSTSSAEECLIDNPVADTWYVEVRGYSAVAGLSIVATVGDTANPPPTSCSISSAYAGSWQVPFGSQWAYMKVGCIEGESANRVAFCASIDGNRRLQLGTLAADGFTIDWDNGGTFTDPQWVMETVGGDVDAYVPAINNILSGFEQAAWPAGMCGVSL